MSTLLKYQDKGDLVAQLQEILSRSYDVEATGIFDNATLGAVRLFQKQSGLVVDGMVGRKTWARLWQGYSEGDSKTLSQLDIIKAASDLGVSPAIVNALNEVEAQGAGFIQDMPKILFEGHVFWKRLIAGGKNPKALKSGNENILYYRWTRNYYKGGTREYQRLNQAIKIHETAALESASWGAFQIMGYHWKDLGYKSVQHFVECMYKSEGEQLQAFVKFLQKSGCDKHAKALNWTKLARCYNGRGFRKNKYHIKLAKAYKRFVAEERSFA